MSELKKILLIEDEPDIRTIAKFALENKGGFTVKYCASGEEAVKEVEVFMPDLILLDVMMPGMDGVQTFRELKEIPALSHIPIIFMTAKVQENEVANYIAMGAVQVISKPFDAIKLADDLRDIWKKYTHN